MEKPNNEELTFEEVRKMENYDFHQGFIPHYKGKPMTKKQIAHHIRILRGMIINGDEYMFTPLAMMLLNAIQHPTPWKKRHVYE